MENQERLQSLDALRGFNMFFIIGGAWIFVWLAGLFPTPFFKELAHQMEHAEWDGLLFDDILFPLFLFIAGVTFPFSLAKQQKAGRSVKSIYRKIVIRGLILVVLGILYNATRPFGINSEELRYASVLGRIGLAWMFGALIYMNTRLFTRVAITVVLLVGYWLLLAWVPAPDGRGAGVFTPEGCLVMYVDRMLLPGHLYFDTYDPEGILSLIPSIGTALLGMFSGEFLRLRRKEWTPVRKVLSLLGAGLVFIGIGLLWNLVFPINKTLWSSSFVCVVGGISMFVLGIFYYIVDVKKCRGRVVFFFTVIGMNSITVYLVNHLFYPGAVVSKLASYTSLHPEITAFLSWMFGLGALWFFLYILYCKRIFLKV